MVVLDIPNVPAQDLTQLFILPARSISRFYRLQKSNGSKAKSTRAARRFFVFPSDV